jgi:hypothetical protein
MPSGEVERHPHNAVDGREITDIEGDRTRREEHRVQKRARVILRAGISNEVLRKSLCLIAKSLQPENARIVAIDEHSLVELIEDECHHRRRL